MIGRFVAVARRRLMLAPVIALVGLVVCTASVSGATGWTGPHLVGPAGNCEDLTATIDTGGRYHVVAECDGRIRYSTSQPGGSWSTTYFAHPLGQPDAQPQIATDGHVVYVAYTRQKFAGCGLDWAGVYYRRLALPTAAWSAATMLGLAGDHLQSFRVVGGTIHATVDNAVTRFEVAYETLAGRSYRRYPISDASGLTSLRIGSDGKARIVYQGANSLRYAVFNGATFTKSSIPGTSSEDRRPVLVLDANNWAHVLWSHEPGPGCAIREPLPADGTYYATNKGGTWTPSASRRFTTDIGPKSLNVDVATGRVYALVGGETGMRYYTKSASGAWSVLKLTSARINSCVIRFDPSSGGLLAVYAREADTNISASVYSFTKP